MSVSYEVLEHQLQVSEQAHAETNRNLQITHQSLLDAQAELGQVRPVADAAHVLCAAVLAFDLDAVERGQDALMAAHQATTPSETPAAHTIVAADRLARLEDALRLIAGERCSNYFSRVGDPKRWQCPDSGRTRISTTGTADAWCDACVAHAAVTGGVS